MPIFQKSTKTTTDSTSAAFESFDDELDFDSAEVSESGSQAVSKSFIIKLAFIGVGVCFLVGSGYWYYSSTSSSAKNSPSKLAYQHPTKKSSASSITVKPAFPTPAPHTATPSTTSTPTTTTTKPEVSASNDSLKVATKPFQIDYSDELLSVADSRILLENPFYARKSAHLSEEINAQSLLLDEKIRLLGRIELYLKGVQKIQKLQYSLATLEQEAQRKLNPAPAETSKPVVAASTPISESVSSTAPMSSSTSRLPEAFEALLDTNKLFAELESQAETQDDTHTGDSTTKNSIDVVPINSENSAQLLIPKLDDLQENVVSENSDSQVQKETDKNVSPTQVFDFPDIAIQLAYVARDGKIYLRFSNGQQLQLRVGAPLDDNWTLDSAFQTASTFSVVFRAGEQRHTLTLEL